MGYNTGLETVGIKSFALCVAPLRFPLMVLHTQRPASLHRVPPDAVPRLHRYYQDAMTPRFASLGLVCSPFGTTPQPLVRVFASALPARHAKLASGRLTLSLPGGCRTHWLALNDFRLHHLPSLFPGLSPSAIQSTPAKNRVLSLCMID